MDLRPPGEVGEGIARDFEEGQGVDAAREEEEEGGEDGFPGHGDGGQRLVGKVGAWEPVDIGGEEVGGDDDGGDIYLVEMAVGRYYITTSRIRVLGSEMMPARHFSLSRGLSRVILGTGLPSTLAGPLDEVLEMRSQAKGEEAPAGHPFWLRYGLGVILAVELNVMAVD